MVDDEEEGSEEGEVLLNPKEDLRVANAEEKVFWALRERGSDEEEDAAGICEDIVEYVIGVVRIWWFDWLGSS